MAFVVSNPKKVNRYLNSHNILKKPVTKLANPLSYI